MHPGNHAALTVQKKLVYAHSNVCLCLVYAHSNVCLCLVPRSMPKLIHWFVGLQRTALATTTAELGRQIEKYQMDNRAGAGEYARVDWLQKLLVQVNYLCLLFCIMIQEDCRTNILGCFFFTGMMM
jgi:hypothetical protein